MAEITADSVVVCRIFLSGKNYFHFDVMAKNRGIDLDVLLSEFLADIARDDREEEGT